MNEDDRRTIYNTQNQKTTEELVEIWRTNDRVEWTDEAFDAIKEILLERLGELPPQNEAVQEHIEVEEDHEFEEDAILGQFVDPDNAPAFYQPRQVLRLEKWIQRAAVASVIAVVITNFFSVDSLQTTILSYFRGSSSLYIVSWLLAIVAYLIFSGLQAVVTFFALKALGWVLKILMEMEFRSRGVNLQQSLASEGKGLEKGMVEGEG
jgi:hypothetical protein